MLILSRITMPCVRGLLFCLPLLCLTHGLLLAQPGQPALVNGASTAFDEANPVISPDGRHLYFTRRFHPENVGGSKDAGDIWYCTLTENGEWGPAVNAGRILNNRHDNAIVGFSPDGRTVYLHGLYRNDGKAPKKQGFSRSFTTPSGWAFPEPINVRYFLNKSKHQSASMAANGKIMVLAAEGYSTQGNEDLYVSFKQADGLWSDPMNLGQDLNTFAQEMTPYLAPDGKTLFFSSNGHGGQGSRDVLVSQRLDDSWRRWSPPVLLENTVNTSGIELHYLLPPAGDFVYWIMQDNSDRKGELVKMAVPEEFLAAQQAAQDIPILRDPTLFLDRPDSVFYQPIALQGVVANASTKESLPAVELVFWNINLYERVFSDGTGTYRVPSLDTGTYAVSLKAQGYFFEEDTMRFVGQSGERLVQNFQLRPIEVGATVQLKNVLFEQGTATLLPASYQALDKVYFFLATNPRVKIELGGHTDNRGSAKANRELSQQRVEEVMDYLEGRGIDSGRMSGKGYGGAKPIASNASERTRRLNRRVEFTITRN